MKKHAKTTSEKRKVKTEAALKKAAIVATAAVTAGTTAKVIQVQRKPFDKSLWNPAFFERNKPINETAIISAHNAGTDPDRGTYFINENQSISTQAILDDTPARALEFAIHKDPNTGELIINHGADHSNLLIDRTVNPLSVNDELNTIDTWLKQPKNADQVLVLEMSNNAKDEESLAKINEMLNSKFGNSIYTKEDLLNDRKTLGRWPTVAELSARGKHIIAIGSGFGDTGTTIPSGWIIEDNFGAPRSNYFPKNMVWKCTWEDRTTIGALGSAAHRDIMDKLDTDSTDALIQQGGMIKIDHLSPNDPRLVDPNKRDQLAFDPDITFLGVVPISRGLASAAVFGSGLAMTSGASAFALASGAYEIYTNEQFIHDAVPNLRSELSRIDIADFIQTSRKDKKLIDEDNMSSLTYKDLIKYSQKKLSNGLRRKTLEAGISNSASLAGSIFSFGLFFPIAFPITSLLSLVTIGTGLISTGIASFFNNRRFNKKIAEALKNPELIMTAKTALTNIKEHAAKKMAKKEHKLMETSKLSSISSKLTFASLFLRVSSFAKYAMPLIGIISGAAVSLIMSIQNSFNIHKNYNIRQEKLKNLIAFSKEVIYTDLLQKKYILWGETPFEEYIMKHKSNIIAKLPLTSEDKVKLGHLSASKLIKELSNINPKILTVLQQRAGRFFVKKEFNEFLKKQKKQGQGPFLIKRPMIEKFLKKKMLDKVSKDVRSSGYINSFKFAALISGFGSLLFPPLAIFFFAGAALGLVVGYITTRIVEKKERDKFSRKFDQLLEGTSDNDLENTSMQELINNLEDSLKGKKRTNLKNYLKEPNIEEASKNVLQNKIKGRPKKRKAKKSVPDEKVIIFSNATPPQPQATKQHQPDLPKHKCSTSKHKKHKD